MATRIVPTSSIVRDLDAAVLDVMKSKIGPELTRAIKAKAPVDSGDLRDSIEWEIDGDALLVGSDLPYAAEVELGTSDTPAQSYLRAGVLGYNP